MTAPRNAQTAALEALIEAHATELKLPTSAAGSARLPMRRLVNSRHLSLTSRRCSTLRPLSAVSTANAGVARSQFPMLKRLEDFNFNENTKIPQATIAALAEGSSITDRGTVILIGDSGTGKTHLATALGICACRQGRRVRFTTLAALANELQEADNQRELARVIARYSRTEVVILDELGYLKLPDGAAELVFQVLSERQERGATIITTNLPFGEWTKVFPDPRLAKAVVDRLTHRAHIIDTGTDSWRFRHGLTRKT